MNRVMRDYFPMFQLYQGLRDELMASLSDDDLAFQPGGANLPLGELCSEIGEVERAYIDSFKTFKLDFAYRNSEPGLAGSVQRLSAWFAELDQELKAAVEALTDDDLDQRVIDRSGGFTLPPQIQLYIYQEALLIFYGKATVYLKAMGKTLPERLGEWIG
jgi:DinB superfamily